MKTKYILLISLLLLVIQENFSQSTNKNYIRIRTYTSNDGISYFDLIKYFDGLGRLEQLVQRKVTPLQRDLVFVQEYDPYGRKSISWLPGVSSNDGIYADPTTVKGSAASNTADNDKNPYSSTLYEPSPLNRVVGQYGPGSDWHSNKKAIYTGFLTNSYKSDVNLTIADSLVCVKYQSSNNPTAINITRSSNYTSGELSVIRIKDENGNISYVFKNIHGQVILTRQINDNNLYDTYYVYDNNDNIRVVIPPEAVTKLGSNTSGWTESDANLNLYCYLYKYDYKKRCIEKKLPGCDPVRYIYDKADQLIFTQDGEQRSKGEWMFSIPDVLGRIVLVGTCTKIKVGSTETEISVGCLNKNLVKVAFASTGAYCGYNITHDTSVMTFITPVILSANYYDNYKFRTLSGFTNLTYTASGIDAIYLKRYGDDIDASLYQHKDLLTGTAQAQMGGSTAMLYAAIYYDNKKQRIQTKSTNHIGGLETEYIAYNFTGQPVKRQYIHSASGKTSQTEYYTYEYDHAGRLLRTKHKLNTGEEIVLAENTYDDLGRLKTNKKGGNENLKTTYGYNVRSWTKSITGPLFSQTLYYNESYGGSTKQYNGNISAMNWTVQGETSPHGYAFDYDNLSRLKSANYFLNGSANTNYKSSYTYDKHGNILTLQRYGKATIGSTYGIVDNLTMNYNGNQLLKATDTGVNVTMAESADFKDYSDVVTEYTYNKNGAMTMDLNKGITHIQYNSLNLPRLIDMKSPVSEARNEYTYSSGGQKLKVVQKWNPNYSTAPVIGSAINTSLLTQTKTIDYVGNKVYENGALKRVLVDGGYIEDVVYYFYLSDHLGNNRVVANATGTPIQKNHYYPFGTAFAEGTPQEQGKQPYKYNGKELDDMHQLNLYDYSARYYESAVGRFTSVDPLAEKYYSISPYAYCANNPLKYIDPTGEAWRPTYDEDQDGNRTYNGYEWIDEAESYNKDGTLKAGLYAQAIFFSENGTFDVNSDFNMGSSTATVYLADGTTSNFDANTNPSSSDYATVPEGIYHATVGKHKGSYTALKMKNESATFQTIELGITNPAFSDGRTYATGINIHKPGVNNKTGMTSSGKAISQGCLLIDINNWGNFIGNFNTDTQRSNTVSITVSRSMATPANVNRLPAFNFFKSGTRHKFFNPF